MTLTRPPAAKFDAHSNHSTQQEHYHSPANGRSQSNPASPESPTSPAAMPTAETNSRPQQGAPLTDPQLYLLAETLNDIEKLRKATSNRLGALTRTEPDKDGHVRGPGMTWEEVEATMPMANMVSEAIAVLEAETVKLVEKHMRKNPFAPFVKRSKGVGAKQMARLLASIGDPYWNSLHNRPRTVSELWAFCGYAVHDGAAQRRTKGQVSNWSNEAKMRTYLIATQIVITGKGGELNDLYYAEKERLVDAVHSASCVRCGPAGHPALEGSFLSDGHKHARALRRVGKELLKLLWMEAKALHEAP